MIYAVATALFLVLATTALHFEGLRLAYRLVLGLVRPNDRQRVLIAVLCTFVVHLLEIGLYALAFWFADVVIDIGGFVGVHVFGPLSYFYFSAETFTTLGLGDILPTGSLRLLASIESINGLMLLGWSASFTYFLMQRFWDEERKVD